MNLARLLSGCLKALGQSNDWPGYFDLSRAGLKQSFLAVALSLPFFYVCAAAVQSNHAMVSQTPPSLPAAAFFIVLLLYALMFPLCAYILCLVFDRQDSFRPWVIARHWTMFFIALIAAAIMGASLAGLIPFMFALTPVFILYLGTLAMDIRYAQKIAGFEWGAAILAGCIITAMSMMMILMGVSQYV